MLNSIRSIFAKPAAKASRSFAAAGSSRLTLDWAISPLSADAAMRNSLGPLRSRSRDLERNNEWVRGFLRTLENNVIGEAGIALQLRIKDPTGKLDEIANDKIETAWWQWGRKGSCTVCGKHSWIDVQKLILRTIARDGECLIRKVVTRQGIKLQLIEADMLDNDLHQTAGNGNQIRYGVEMDSARTVTAFWLLGRHPGDMDFQSPARKHIRVPAGEIFHLHRSDRIDQTRGLPWLVASMKALKMLDGYAEAELVAARTGAAKMGFFTRSTPDGWSGEVDAEGNLSMDASPGTIEELPAGMDFKAWDSDHPNAGYGDFVKSMLRGVATSLGISYNTLSSDLEGVNYSSIRAGLLEEREVWKGLQRFLIEHFCEPLFTDWLTTELQMGRLGLPAEKIWKFDVPEFQGRRWAWVDPKKDMDAAILAVRSGQKSLRQIISENGGDVYDTFRSIKADQDLALEMGINLPELVDPPKPAAPVMTIDTGE
jgi:lambda family phage portal protein